VPKWRGRAASCAAGRRHGRQAEGPTRSRRWRRLPGGLGRLRLRISGAAFRQLFQARRPRIEAGDAFTQEDADYLPLPFAKGLRVTWEGTLAELHFYHLQVRLYPPGTAVRTFDPARDLRISSRNCGPAWPASPSPRRAARRGWVKFAGTIKPSESWTWSPEGKGSGAIRELKLRLQDGHSDAPGGVVCCGFLRRFAAAPSGGAGGRFLWLRPWRESVFQPPMTVEPNGWMTCRFVMPYEKSVKIEIVNYSGVAVQVDVLLAFSAWEWNDRSLYFRAKWRVDHDLLAGAGALICPSRDDWQRRVRRLRRDDHESFRGSTAGGNWLGRRRREISGRWRTDACDVCTGSEDYFNYAWSRCTLFAHPYCGQPLDSGPTRPAMFPITAFKSPTRFRSSARWRH